MTFWTNKKLTEMTPEEWESLCDHCGKCCLHKLENEDTGEIFFTDVACKLLKINTCQCTHYNQRNELVPECLNIRKMDTANYDWLPSTCAYRLLNDNQPLPSWHPLIKGNTKAMKKKGVSVSNYAISESPKLDLEDHIINWII